jgi:two-component system, chemotaxis family, sensor kinase CheA
VKDLQQKLIAAFKAEYREHLSATRSMLDGLEQASWDPGSVDLTELHRRVHSLKGAARAVDIKPIETTAHRMESAFEACQAGRLTLDAAVVRVLRIALDAIEDCAEARFSGDEEDIPENVATSLSGLLADRAVGGQPEREHDQQKRPAPARDTPSASTAKTEPPPRPRSDHGSEDTAVESVRVNAETLDELLRWSGDFFTVTSTHQSIDGDVRELESRIGALKTAATVVRGFFERSRRAVDAAQAPDEMRALHDVELQLQSLNTFAASLKKRHGESSWQLRTMAVRLDEQVRRARMIPADSVFSFVAKMVRDLAKSEGKEVVVSVRGLDAMADRWVLQALRDPVLHLMRNAVSHGIETPDVRVKAGKPREGRVAFAVEVEGGELVLRVEDDGRGLDAEQIRRVAIERGLIDADAPAVLEGAALATVLANPGFSTAATVTEVAGRGIGLSVVQQAVNRLEGRLDVAPNADAGTALIIRVPVSISSRRLLHVTWDGRVFCIPLRGVERVHRIPMGDVDTVEGRPIAYVEGAEEPLWLAPFGALLGEDATLARDPDDMLTVVVLRSDSRKIGAVVDAVTGIRDGLVRTVGGAARGIATFSGGVVCDDGTVVPALNVNELLRRWRGDGGGLELRHVPAEHKGPPTVLGVDDSITTRTLEKSLLEAHGYRVELSVDGVDALELLHRDAVDLVVADVEMPRMDGFGLLQAMKRDSALASIPVVLVTSRDRDEDRRRGLQLGAEAYVVKQRFDQQVLLDTIGQLL